MKKYWLALQAIQKLVSKDTDSSIFGQKLMIVFHKMKDLEWMSAFIVIRDCLAAGWLPLWPLKLIEWPAAINTPSPAPCQGRGETWQVKASPLI